MKKIILSITFLALVLSFTTACGNKSEEENKDNQPKPTIESRASEGAYTMVGGEEDESVLLPYININYETNTFSFSYDMLSSYLPFGTFEIVENELIATTDDGLYKYYFQIIDEKTLSFEKNKSSQIQYIDSHAGVRIEDGALFVRDNKEISE